MGLRNTCRKVRFIKSLRSHLDKRSKYFVAHECCWCGADKCPHQYSGIFSTASRQNEVKHAMLTGGVGFRINMLKPGTRNASSANMSGSATSSTSGAQSYNARSIRVRSSISISGS